MYNIIRTFCISKITALNTSLTNDLTETTASLDLEKLPANQLNNYYQIRLKDGYKMDDDTESQILYSADVNIKFTFGLYKKDVSEYSAIIDDYIHSLVRIFRSRNTSGNRLPYTSSGVIISKIKEIEVSGLYDIVNGNYLQPELTFKLLILDNNTVNLTPPSVPTLGNPTNGYTNGLLDQSFNWSGTADTWEFKITTGSTIVLQQAGLTSSSFTIPLDALLSDATLYSWTVRGYNEAGYGDWATPFTFTTNDVDLPETPVLDQPANGVTKTSLTVLHQWSTGARATSYTLQIASDSGFTSIVDTITGITATYYSYTYASDNTYYWRVKSVNGSGESAYTSGRSVIVDAPIPDYRTGLVAEWLADTGVTSDQNGVSAWLDTVSSRSAGQTVNANKPYYAMNQQNGKPVVRFAGSGNTQWLTFPSLALTNFTIIIGYKATSFAAGDSNYLFAGSGQGIFSSINALSIGYGEFDGTRIRAVTYNAGDTTWHVRSFQNTKMYSNGTEATYSNTQNMTGLTLTHIGTRGDNTSLSFKGDVGFIRVYDSALSTTNRAIAENYLLSIWGNS